MPKRRSCGIVLRDPVSICALLFEKRWTNEQVMSKGRKESQPLGWEAMGKIADNVLLSMGCDTGLANDMLRKMQPPVTVSNTSKAQMQSSAKSVAAIETPMRTRRGGTAVNLQRPSTPGASVSLVAIAAANTSPSECKTSVPVAAAAHSMASARRSRAPAASQSKNGGRGSGVSKVCLYLLLRLQNPNSH